MKSMPFVVSIVWMLCTPLASSAAGPPQEPELMTEEPAGQATSQSTTAEDVVVSDVAVFPADPGEEDPEIALTFWEARDHIAQGRWQYARTLLEDALERFPSSRHLHQQLAELLWFEYNDVSGEADTLAAAAHHATAAEDLALGVGRSDAALHHLTAKLLGRTGDVATLDRLFESILAVDPSAETHLAYGDALALAGDQRAEEAYRAAIERRPNDAEARIRLAEYLLLEGHYRRGLDELNRRPRVSNGSISTSGACQVSGSFSVSAGTHLGHLEGPEVTTNPDLDLYLQRLDGTAWTNVASAVRIASVEDLSHSGTTATYRWQVCSFSGTGSYRLYTKRP